MQLLAGLHTFVAKFFYNGTHASNAAYRCLQTGTRTQMNMKLIYREVLREMIFLTWKFDSGTYPEIKRAARWWHPEVSYYLMMLEHLYTISKVDGACGWRK